MVASRPSSSSVLERYVASRGSSADGDGGGSARAWRPAAATVVLLGIAGELVFIALLVALLATSLDAAENVSTSCLDIPSPSGARRVQANVTGLVGAAIMMLTLAVAGTTGFVDIQLRGALRERFLVGITAATVLACCVAEAWRTLFVTFFTAVYVLFQDNFLAVFGGAPHANVVPVLGGVIAALNYILVSIDSVSCARLRIADSVAQSLSSIFMARVVRIMYVQFRAYDHVFFGSYNLKVAKLLRGEQVDAATRGG